jgi:hypothetical protein
VQDAQYATQTEGAAIAQLLNLTDHFEDPQTAEAVQTAVLDYTNTIVNEQWPLLEVADGLGASAVGLTASTALGDRIPAAKAADESSSPVWGQIEATLGDLGQASIDRLRDLPTSNAPFRIALVIVLGATMLIATAAFLPTRIKAYRAALVLMAALVSLLVFAMVQTSNPYAQNITPAPLVLAERLSTQ